MADFDAIESIKKRTSVRTYSKRPVEERKLESIKAFVEENAGNPFGAAVRLNILHTRENPRIGAYGLIRGAKVYLAGCVEKSEKDVEGFGYEFERAILYATSLGLGTCWIGGLFTRGAFSAALKPDGGFIPAVSPVGYAAEKTSLPERIFAAGVGARARKPFAELFFDGEFGNPIKADEKTAVCLEMVRIGPSASNKQPWRAVRNEKGIHFYLKEDKKYAGNTMFGFCMQRLDMGIAACHFELSARRTGLSGGIVFEDPGLPLDSGLNYSFTWRYGQR